jgi:hypothetical protein
MTTEAMHLALKALLLEDMACRYDKEQTPQHIAEAITALQSIISQDALYKMAEDARELGLDYEPAVQEKCFLCGERVASCTSDVCPKSAQPAVQDGRDWSLLEATQESLREHMAEIKRLQKEIIEQCRIIAMSAEREDALRAEIKRLKAAQPEIKLKEKNHG